MRARLALMHCGAQCILREVLLKDKPAQLIEVSNKGTVPVLVLPIVDKDSTSRYRVLDESIDIMHWAMNENPSRHLQNAEQWLINETMSADEINALINQNDFEFKDQLDKYKYSDRHPEHPQDYYLEQSMPFLEKLESILCHSPYLGGSQFRFPDAAILPFIRQFSMVKPEQFNALPLANLQHWLAKGLESDLFISVMDKTPQWKAESVEDQVVFGKSQDAMVATTSEVRQ
jgi:glutathione S-transferase